MKHIKHFALFESSSGRIYVVLFGFQGGPDYEFESFALFKAENDVDAKEKFLDTLEVSQLHDKTILDKHPEISNEFVQEIVDDGYFTGAGWYGGYAVLLGDYPVKPGESLSGEILTFDSKGWDRSERKNAQRECRDRLAEVLGKREGYELFYQILFEDSKELSLEQLIAKNWAKIGADDRKSLLFALSPEKLDSWMRKNPLDLDLLDDFPEIKAGVLKRTGLRDISKLSASLRNNLI